MPTWRTPSLDDAQQRNLFVFLPNTTFYVSLFFLTPFYQTRAHVWRVPTLSHSHVTPLHLLVRLQSEGVTLVNILHSHLHDTIGRACHLGCCLVLARRLASQSFDICLWKSFDAARRPWEKLSDRDDAHVTALRLHYIWGE